MVNFNFFRIDRETVQNNQKIIGKKLPSNERIALARILQDSNHAHINK